MQHTNKRSLGVWMAAAVVAAGVTALLAFNAHVEHRAASKRVGILIDAPGGRLEILAVNEGLPAAEAGLRVEDTILALNGQPVSTLPEYDRVMAGYTPGTPLVYTIERAGETREFTVMPGTGFPWVHFLSILGPTAAYLALGLLCLLHWRQDLRARLLAILVLAIAVELALPSMVIGNPWLLSFSTAVYFLLTGIQIAVNFHLISLIPARAPWIVRWPRLVGVFYIVGLGFGGAVAGATLFKLLIPMKDVPAATELGFSSLNVILPVWALCIGAMLIYQMLNYPSPRGRQQAGLVFMGLAPWIFVTLLSTTMVLAAGWIPTWLFYVENWALMAFPVAIFVAIFRYHLFDLELVVRRGLLYGTIAALVIGGLYAMLAAAWPLLTNTIGTNLTPWLITGAALLLGALASGIRRRLEQVIEVRVFPERHALRRHLIRLASSLSVRGKLSLMGSFLADELCLAFRAQSSSIIMIDTESQLPYVLASTRTDATVSKELAALFRTNPGLEQLLTERRRPVVVSQIASDSPLQNRLHELNISVIAPLLARDQFIGAMCLGQKHLDAPYPREELDLINLLSHHVTSAFENARLAEHATFDRLTGLYRREVILDILERECARAIQTREPIAVAMIDVDHFKATNDAHGHLAGDRILKRVAETIQGELRSTDLVGRYGGEEFLAVLVNTGLDGARTAAEHVRSGIESLHVDLESGVSTRCSISVGLAALTTASGTAESLARAMLETADRYLYEAKQKGRNRVIAKHHTAGAA